MARIPYADPHKPETKEQQTGSSASVAACCICTPCCCTAARSPKAGCGSDGHPTSVRASGFTPELVLQIAHLNGAAYEAEQHAPIALKEGLTQAQVDALPNWKGTGLFDATQEAVLAYCDAMNREIHVPAETFAPVRAALDERCLVELTATIGAYNMVSRFIEALGMDPKDDLSNREESSRVQP